MCCGNKETCVELRALTTVVLSIVGLLCYWHRLELGIKSGFQQENRYIYGVAHKSLPTTTTKKSYKSYKVIAIESAINFLRAPQSKEKLKAKVP